MFPKGAGLGVLVLKFESLEVERAAYLGGAIAAAKGFVRSGEEQVVARVAGSLEFAKEPLGTFLMNQFPEANRPEFSMRRQLCDTNGPPQTLRRQS